MSRTATIIPYALCVSLLATGSAAAHPLGNFTINHLARIQARATELRVHYVLDIAEIPTFQIMHAAGTWTPARMREWADSESALVVNGFSIKADGAALALHLEAASARTRAGAGGLPILYWTGDYTAALGAKTSIAVNDRVYADRRIGWKDIIVPGIVDPTAELRSYPSALIGSPRRNDRATFEVRDGRIVDVRIGGSEAEAWNATSIVKASALSDLVAYSAQTPVWVLLTILAAFGLGALHGLEPGHGKAILAFTLVGARATFKQAAILAAALTFAHTIAVLSLGVLLCFAAGFATERLFTWITLLSGAAVAFIGARGLARALSCAAAAREHSHAHARGIPHHHHDRGEHSHSHAIPGSAPLHFRSAVLAAMSGGIAPCPAAIVVLLTALHMHRVGYGLLLIVVFSLGLAAILSGLGLAVVRGASWLSRRSQFARVATFAPIATAGVISIIGAIMLAQGAIGEGLPFSEPVAAAATLLCVAALAFSPALFSTRSAHRALVIKETT